MQPKSNVYPKHALLACFALFSFLFSFSQNSSFTVNDSAQCLTGNSYTFTNVSTGSGNTYLWKFGDGTTSTSNSPTKVFTTAGIYSVELITTNSGIDYYSSKTISVDPMPNASFYSIASTSSGGSYTFISTSTISSGSMNYSWSFGDGTSSTQINPTKNYLATGTYAVTLTVTSNGGCVSTSTQNVNVTLAGLLAAFDINSSTSQCLSSNNFTFTNQSSSAANITYSWDFGAGATPATFTGVTPPSVSYATAGSKTITLTVNSTSPNATAVSTQTLNVSANPTASFTYTNSSNVFSFTSTSTNTSNISWLSNGSNIGSGNSLNYTFGTPGTYIIKLAAQNGNCFDTSTQTITAPVAAPTPAAPVAAFSVASTTTQCVTGNSYTFTNTSTGTGNTYQWSFPNATPSTSTSMNPGTIVFNGSGVYVVTLTVTNAGGTSSTTQTVTVSPKPTASFSESNTGNDYTFHNGSYISNGAISSYDWSVDGTTFSTVQNPPVQTLATGTRVVRLIVNGAAGCADTLTKSINVSTTPAPAPGAPVAAFSVASTTTQCVTGNSYTFTNTSTGTGNTYQWSFPNATPSSSTSMNPGTVVFNGSGIHTVTLTVTNANGTSSSNQTVTVSSKPTASFSESNTGNSYTFHNGSYISNGAISSYDWSVDGTTFSTIQNPPVQILTVGTRVIRLIVVGAAGCADTLTKSINVTATSPAPVPVPGAPVSSFSISTLATQCLAGNSFDFTNTSTGTANTYAWTFAGGTPATSTSANPTGITFATAGNHLITLVATNANGTSTSTQYAIIANPIASFNTLSTTNAGNSYTFISTSTVPSGTMTYSWDFGDGSPSSSLVNPTHTYATPGTYTVTLTVTGSSGCPVSTATATVTYCPKAIAGFSVSSTTSQCLTGNSFTFTNSSSNSAGTPASAMTYLWKFGDGTTSTLQNPPAKSYTTWGDYDVQLFATLTSGSCTHTDSVKILKAVSAEPMPVASYNLYLDTYLQVTALYSDTVKRCFRPGMDFAYHSSSTVARGQMAIRKWSFETAAIRFREGDSVNYHNPRIIFDSAGTYHVKHTITSDKGCKDSVIRVVRLSNPRSVFTADTIVVPDAYAAPQVVLTNNSYDYGGRIVSYNWTFGGAGASPASSTAQNPANVTYNCGGTKTITLSITSDIGCVNTTTRDVVIKIKPKAGFTIGTPTYSNPNNRRPRIVMTNTTSAMSADLCPSYTYLWTATNATITSSNSTNPSIQFNASGTQTVGLFVTNTNGGKTDYTENTVLVAIQPTANFTTSVQSATPNGTRQVTVTNTSTSQDLNPGAAIALHTYSINWGDGIVETGTGTSNLTHVYASGGTYTVSLTITNPVSGLSHTASSSVTVNIQPMASFTTSAPTYSPDVYAQPSYSFDGTASTVSNDATGSLTYSWNFGSGATPSTATGVIPPTVTYSSSGTKTVTLTVTNSNGGLTHQVTQNVIVSITPKASFTSALDYNGDNYSNPDVNFTNATTINDASASLSYNWNFGVGASPATSTSATPPSVTYSSGGTKTVTLTVTNNSGTTVSDTYTATVDVIIVPKAKISIRKTTVSTPAPLGIGATVDYEHYEITGINNALQPSSVVTGSIASSTMVISYTTTSNPTPTILTTQNGTPFTDVNFSISEALKADYTFTINLTITSDLGQTDVATVTLQNGVVSGTSGYSFRNATINNTPHVTIPPITGTTRSSSVVSAATANNNLKGFVVYPNPTKSSVLVNFETTAKSVSIQIIDMNGKVVKLQKEQNSTGTKVISSINVNSLPAGTYNILLLNDKGVKLGNSKFIKAN